MKATVCVGLLLCTVAHAAAPDNDEESVVLVGPSRQECFRNSTQEAQWTIKGDVEVGEVLHVLSRLACERYLVTRELMHQRVTIGVSSEKLPMRELRSRVIGALRANGVAVDMDMSYHVTKGGQERDLFSGGYTPPPPATPSAISDEELDKGISCEGTRCRLSRALWDKWLGDTSSQSRDARLVPSIKDGMPNGFKLYAIRPKSLIGRLGLQNGDTLMTINGMEITSPDKALEVYVKVKNATKLTLGIQRRGVAVTQEIVVK